MAAKRMLSDQELLTMLREGNAAAYKQIFDRYQPLLYVYACRITKDEDEAADLVQDVFLSLWNRRESLELKGTFLYYLYASVRFGFFNLLDKKKVRNDYVDSLRHFIHEGSPITDHQVEEREMLRLIEQQIEHLPPRLKLIYELSRKANMTASQIAQQTGVSEKTVQNQISMAVRHLKIKLGILRTMGLMFMIEGLTVILKKL